MATNVDTAVTTAARKAQIFTMSDGNLVAVYYNGTAWGYRIKASGTWGARTALTSSPAQTGACWVQDGNNLFGAVSGPSFFYIYKLAYSSGSVTQTNTLTGDNGVVVAGYLDTTNARFNVPVMLSNAGIYLYSFATSNLATGINAAQITAGSPPTTLQTDVTWAAAGAGAGTWQIAWCATTGATAFNVVTMVTTTTAITSQTAETSVPALAANCAGLDAIYDGTNVVFAANQNNAALRWSRRTAANTYDAWTTLVTETIGGAPTIAKKGTGGAADLIVAYQSKGSQANGEIATFKRLSGTWDASKTTLAGGSAAGWASPAFPRSDVNQTSGNVPAAYITGTANPWTLVEDTATIGAGGGGSSLTQTINDTATITDSPSTSFSGARAQAIDDTATISETIAMAVTRTIADTATIADTGTALDSAYAVNDTATVADQATNTSGYARAVTDTATVADSVDTGGSVSRTQNVDDTATIADSTARDIGRALTDTLAGADATTFSVAKTVDDALTAADQATTAWDAVRQLADTLTAGDSVSTGASTDHVRQIDDTASTTEQISRAWDAQRALAETATLADNTAFSWAATRTLTDVLTVTEHADGIGAPVVLYIGRAEAAALSTGRVERGAVAFAGRVD